MAEPPSSENTHPGEPHTPRRSSTANSPSRSTPNPISPRLRRLSVQNTGPQPDSFDHDPSPGESREPSGATNTTPYPLSPTADDRVFPISSVVSVDATPMSRSASGDGFPGMVHPSSDSYTTGQFSSMRRPADTFPLPASGQSDSEAERNISTIRSSGINSSDNRDRSLDRQSATVIRSMAQMNIRSEDSEPETTSEGRASTEVASLRSKFGVARSLEDVPLVTARFKHVVTDEGHAVITGRDNDTLQRCEDEPIHIPGAVQGFGLLIALREEGGKFVVRVVSENSMTIIGYTPQHLFSLDNFLDILTEEQADNLLDHLDFIREDETDVPTNGPEVFMITLRPPRRRTQKLWCAMHINEANKDLIICEFELEDDQLNPLVPAGNDTPEPPEDTLGSHPTPEEFAESTVAMNRPLRVLRSARKKKGEAAAMEVFNVLSQVQEQLASATTIEIFLKVLIGVVKELTGFHRVMIYQFDKAWNGRVVAELIDPRATKDLYQGLNFPASDIPKQARDLYRINKVRLLYDRDQETARLVCRTLEDLETPLDLTYSYLRAMSPIHLKYLGNMQVRASMSISINAFNELWGLIACHTYGAKGMRVSFPIRKMCRLVGDNASRNIERLSYASRLQSRKLINTVPTEANPSGYIVASSDDLLKLFNADCGALSIRDETKLLGKPEQTHEILAILEYLRQKLIGSVMTSQDISIDFPDLRYAPGFRYLAGLLYVPLSGSGNDFIVFFRKGHIREVKWAGNPYEKFIKEGTEGYLEPRKSFRTWSEMIIGKCRDWTEEEIGTAAVLCLVYGKFIEVWRQKETVVQNSQLTKLLLANSAHEVRTPLHQIVNFLEIAMEGTVDSEVFDALAKSHSASKSLIYVINDLLDLTRLEHGQELVKDDIFDLPGIVREATDVFQGETKRKKIEYDVHIYPGTPSLVVGDQRRVRQVVSNIIANAVQHTDKGSVKVEVWVSRRSLDRVDVEFGIQDTGTGMSAAKLDALFRDLEQVSTEEEDIVVASQERMEIDKPDNKKRTLGLGLAIVARLLRLMNGQLRLKSEEGQGSRFVIQLPFDLPEEGTREKRISREGDFLARMDRGSEIPETPPATDGEILLVDKSASRKLTRSPLLRGNSATSAKSIKSTKSQNSQRSNKSDRDIDRLIDAIQEPMRSTKSDEDYGASPGDIGKRKFERRPILDRTSTAGSVVGEASEQEKSMSVGGQPRQEALVLGGFLNIAAPSPGEVRVTDSLTSVKAIKIGDDDDTGHAERRSLKTPSKVLFGIPDQIKTIPEPLNAKNLRVLVAEDDPINSKILKKRLEKIGHEVYLTVNGEECASLHGDKPTEFDIVLMDIQMPIVDGMTSTKMIRSFEKTRPSNCLSKRASLNGRIPIFAVSASLVEREKQTYMDVGFDGWILKPIDFKRVELFLEGIVNESSRNEALYEQGKWERGGWFMGNSDPFTTNTKPSGKSPPIFTEPTSIPDSASKNPVTKSQGSEKSRTM